MFAYCLNNPVNYKDDYGNAAIAAAIVVDMAISGFVGGFVSAICTFSTAGSASEVAQSFAVGFAEGAIVSRCDEVAFLFAALNAWNTVDQCLESGASYGASFSAGGLALLSGLPYNLTDDNVTNVLVDLTFGMGGSLLSEGVTAAVQIKAPVAIKTTAPLDAPIPISKSRKKDNTSSGMHSVTSNIYFSAYLY